MAVRRRHEVAPAARPGLTRERIREAALRVVDAAGPEGLSMRRLAAELGVDPMAVYHYFPGKRAILLALVADVFARTGPVDPAASWQDQLRQWARAYRTLARAHPGLALSIVGDAEAVGIAALHANEPLVAALEASRPALGPEVVAGAISLLVDYVNGSLLPEAFPASPGNRGNPLVAALAGQPADRFPAQRRLLAVLPAGAIPDAFEFGLEVVVAGLERLCRPDG
jgi:TetR/AcrR family transcriptional regulator, tetracycline repressor protein